MANRPVDPKWRRVVEELLEDGQSPRWIANHLREQVGYPPSQSTIYNIAREHDRKGPEERVLEARYSWPESHDPKRQLSWLAWADAGQALELVRHCDRLGWRPPSHRQLRWFLRLRQAAPELPAALGYGLSAALATKEYLADDPAPGTLLSPAIRLLLIHQPWRSERRHRDWFESLQRNNIDDAVQWSLETGDMTHVEYKHYLRSTVGLSPELEAELDAAAVRAAEEDEG